MWHFKKFLRTCFFSLKKIFFDLLLFFNPFLSAFFFYRESQFPTWLIWQSEAFVWQHSSNRKCVKMSVWVCLSVCECVWVCVSVCECVWERDKERERGRERGIERERGREGGRVAFDKPANTNKPDWFHFVLNFSCCNKCIVSFFEVCVRK